MEVIDCNKNDFLEIASGNLDNLDKSVSEKLLSENYNDYFILIDNNYKLFGAAATTYVSNSNWIEECKEVIGKDCDNIPFINEFGTDLTMRGKGLGMELLKGIIDYFNNSGFVLVTLNDNAEKFWDKSFSKLGYKKIIIADTPWGTHLVYYTK